MQQQLRLNSVNTGRVLQRLRHMVEQPFAEVGRRVRRTEHVTDHAFAAFINEEGVPDDFAVVDGRIPGKYLGVQVAKNHLG